MARSDASDCSATSNDVVSFDSTTDSPSLDQRAEMCESLPLLDVDERDEPLQLDWSSSRSNSATVGSLSVVSRVFELMLSGREGRSLLTAAELPSPAIASC